MKLTSFFIFVLVPFCKKPNSLSSSDEVSRESGINKSLGFSRPSSVWFNRNIAIVVTIENHYYRYLLYQFIDYLVLIILTILTLLTSCLVFVFVLVWLVRINEFNNIDMIINDVIVWIELKLLSFIFYLNFNFYIKKI